MKITMMSSSVSSADVSEITRRSPSVLSSNRPSPPSLFPRPVSEPTLCALPGTLRECAMPTAAKQLTTTLTAQRSMPLLSPGVRSATLLVNESLVGRNLLTVAVIN
eukprot:scaffold34872_cov400-Skeletonema_menzelii.AAC.1